VEPNASTANDVRRSSPGKGTRRRTRGTHAAAIWAVCLAAGIGIGVLTDGGDGPLPRAEPEAAEDGDRLPAPAGEEATDLIDHVAGTAVTRGADEAAAGVAAAAATDPLAALVEGTAPATGSTAPDAEDLVGGLPEGPAREILEDLLPDVIVDPPAGEAPGGTTSTTVAPSTTTTTAAPITTTTTAPPGGGGPVITPLPDVGGP
jgi:hypothetical protein